MPRFLALDWDHDQMHLVALSASRDKVQVEQAVVWNEPCTQDPAALAQAGSRLRERLRAARIAPAPVLGVVARERVILKELRYPPADETQEPSLVRNQMVKELTEPLDRVVIDFLRLPVNPRERHAQVMILRKPVLLAWQNLLKAAGLKLLALTPRPFGLAGCLPTELKDQTVAVLNVNSHWAEFVVVSGGLPVFARSLPSEANLAEEVRRNLILYAGQARGTGSNGGPVRQLFCNCDASKDGLLKQLRGLLAIPVEPLELPGGTQHRETLTASAGFAPLLGLAQIWGQQQKALINFVAPREPKVDTGTSRERVVVRVGLAVLLVILLIFGGLLIRSNTQNRLDEVTQELANVKAQLDKLQPAASQFAQLKKWEMGALPWLDELYDLTARFPDRENFRVNQIFINPLDRESDKFTMRMTINGVVPLGHSRLIDDLVSRINRESHGHCRASKETLKTPQGNQSEDTQEFTVYVDMIRQDLKKYDTELRLPPTYAPRAATTSPSDKTVQIASQEVTP